MKYVMRDIDGTELKIGDLVWMIDHKPIMMAMVLGEQWRDNAIVRMIGDSTLFSGFTISLLNIAKVQQGQYLSPCGTRIMEKD